MDDQGQQQNSRSLGVWDAASLLIGIVVGTAIFKTPPLVFGNVATPTMGMLLWAGGAILSLCGALCYCELATTYPQFGGEYAFLSHGFGRRIGFLFAWMQLSVITTGSIGAMAFVFADYAVPLDERLAEHQALLASVAVIGLALIQYFGFQTGKVTQNILTASKLIALFAILAAGLLYSSEADATKTAAAAQSGSSNLGLALVFVLLAYGGWNDAAMVTPEVRDHQRNMPRALLLGLGIVALFYLALNLAFLRVLGFEGVRSAQIPAAEVVGLALGDGASKLMGVVVMCSALGAIHGMLFTSCRLLAAVGEDYAVFNKWSRWNNRGVPVAALLSIVIISLGLILAVGTESGRQLTANAAVAIQLPEPKWDQYFGGFDTLIAATAPVFWMFFTMSALSVVVLRYRDANRERPFRIPFYPLPVLVFCGFAVFMLWKSLDYAGELTQLSLPIFLLGLALSFSKANTNHETS